MWRRKELKKNARLAMRKNYWLMIAVCFILAIFAGKYFLSTTLIHNYSNAEADVVNAIETKDESNSDIVNAFAKEIFPNSKIVEFNVKDQANKGILASMFNNVTDSGSYIFGTLNSVNQIFFKDKVGAGIIILIGTIIGILFKIFVVNLIRIGELRFFLENHLYHKTKAGRIFFLFKVRRFIRPTLNLFFKDLYLFLWLFTIVGYPIKRYSYRMIPYIIAENPEIKRKDAFALSIAMMKGNKWRAFILDMSFLGWWFLEVLTIGLLGLFYVNAYFTMTQTELYLRLRNQALEEGYKNAEYLNDPYLTKLPAENTLGEHYPVALYPIPEAESKKIFVIDYHVKYTLWSLILIFFAVAAVGWLWEVGYHFFKTGDLVNRGSLYGPWLPIYGFGAVGSLVLVRKTIDKPILTFFLIMVICGVVEYFTSYAMEMIYHVKWWDYSGYLLNINGRICLEGTIFFGVGGCAIIYIFAPFLNHIAEKINKKHRITLFIILISLFALDCIYSHSHPNMGKGITYGNAAEIAMGEVRESAEKLT